MPYNVSSYCSACDKSQEFAIGLWPTHLGVLLCPSCKEIVNIPLSSEKCPSCDYKPKNEEFFDYAQSIPYLGKQSQEEAENSPVCPNCEKGKITFETTSHFNVGRLGTPKNGQKPWLGKQYLEKAIFLYALIAVCGEYDLDDIEMMEYYNIDSPGSLLVHRSISLPIFLDIRAHLFAMVASDEATFKTSDKLCEEVYKQYSELFNVNVMEPQKRWWQFWK